MATYLEVARKIRSKIDAGLWAPGDQLPTTEEFAQLYDVSESTAYHALRHLRDLGLIVGQQGGRRYVPVGETDSSAES